MMLKDKLEHIPMIKTLSEPAKAAANMFVNCLRFNGIGTEEVHVCFDDDGVLHKWNQFHYQVIFVGNNHPYLEKYLTNKLNCRLYSKYLNLYIYKIHFHLTGNFPE